MRITKGQIIVTSGIILLAYYLIHKGNKKNEVVEVVKKSPDPVPNDMSKLDVVEEPTMSDEDKERENNIKKHESETLEKAKKFLDSKGITDDMIKAAGKGDAFILKYASTLGWSGN